ncbi:hypothetical protein EVAR_27850_1 [Eumeta japonica]|uniref:Uncharacterized protein n=1 Tax=Eumeta variegata TaxID=151549 RepID=A0A4C1VJA1_EUMVA|nr:hypothetical protein EVAR_27850_1 [Eumeta japonica]
MRSLDHKPSTSALGLAVDARCHLRPGVPAGWLSQGASALICYKSPNSRCNRHWRNDNLIIAHYSYIYSESRTTDAIYLDVAGSAGRLRVRLPRSAALSFAPITATTNVWSGVASLV